jgi:OmcA/MtrC family decaheme c-type cytochrome
VTFTLKDSAGLAVAGAEAKNFEFHLAKLIPASTTKPTYWQSYINRSDQEGTGAKVIAGGAERGKPVAVAGSTGTYKYTFCTPLAAVASFQYYGSGTEPAGSCSSTVVANAGVINSAAWNALKGTLDLAYNANASTRLAIAGRDGAIVNLVQDFVPASLPNFLAATANQVATDASCGACHAQSTTNRAKLLFAGGHLSRRYMIELCVACHNPTSFNSAASTDASWSTIDFKVLIHQYHGTHDYPQNSPFGGVSAIGTGWNNNTAAPGVINCRTCHDNQNVKVKPFQPTSRSDAEKAAWATQLSQQACGSCHNGTIATKVDFSNHFGNQPDNAQCALCHGVDRSEPVAINHATPYPSPNNPELAAGAKKVEYEISSVTVDAATGRPTVKFRVVVDGTPLNLKTLPANGISIGGVNMRLAWSAPMPKPVNASSGPAIAKPLDWNNFGVTLNGRAYWNNDVPLGPYTGNPPAPVPASPLQQAAFDQPASVNLSTTGVIASLTGPDANGFFTTVPGINPAAPLAFPSYANLTLKGVAIESYLTINSMNISGKAALKGVDGANTLRRVIVDIDSCNACHERVGFHSNAGRMNNPDYCATCHNPELSSSNVFAGFATYTGESRYYSQKPNNFKDMIHSIHAGEMRKENNPADPFNFIRGNPNATGGNGPMVFEDVIYPAQIGDCKTCHVAATFGVPSNTSYAWSAIDVQPALGTVSTFNPALTVRWGPGTAACGSCHNSPSASSHYVANTVPGTGESCSICHGAGGTYEVHK